MQALDIAVLRGQFPALNQLVEGKAPFSSTAPVALRCHMPYFTAMTDYLGHFNANLGPLFLGQGDRAAGAAGQAGGGCVAGG